MEKYILGKNIIAGEIVEILRLIEGAGFQAYIVGGAVRNSLLGLEINDYDLATSARPEEMDKIFKDYKTFDIGRDFGSLLLLYKGYKVEITSFRREGVYLDGRRPDQVSFSRDLKTDLMRRDFTINALAWRPGELVDYFGARKDLEAGLIKTVGKPMERFSEDYLRILRAIRFASQLDFKIEEETYKALAHFKNKILLISRERIREELFKIVMAPKPSLGLEYMRETGLLEQVLPSLSETIGFNQYTRFHQLDLYQHSLKTMDLSPQDLSLRLAALFHDLGKLSTRSWDGDNQAHYYNHHKESSQIARAVLSSFNSPKKLINSVETLVYYHMVDLENFSDKTLKKYLNKLGKLDLKRLVQLQIADRLSGLSNLADISGLLSLDGKIEELGQKVYNEKQLAIDGNDVIELGYKKGPIIGEILLFALDKVMDNEEVNKKEILLELIEENFLDRREI